MNLVDANVLLYAVNESEERHDESRGWLDGALSAGESTGFAWIVVLAFLRLSTRIGLFPDPLPIRDAVSTVRGWLGHPASVIVEPTGRHGQVLLGLIEQLGTGGNLVSDAHLAALALEHDATVVTYDNDFGRFGVRWQRPDGTTAP